jgi:shikimate dehydrogenase
MTVALLGRPSELEILGVVEDELARLGRDITMKSVTEVRTRKLDDATLAAAAERAEVLLHCTPIGMTPETERTLVPRNLLRPDLAVFDAVYNPRRTLLLREAAALGCRVVEGMEMFLGQAMVQFQLWTGKAAPVDAMRKVIEARL